MRNFTPIDNDVKRVFFAPDTDLDYGDFAVYVYIAMHVRVKDGDLKGLAYPTKKRMQSDLSIGRRKLSEAIEKLVRYGFIIAVKVPNKYGGKPLLHYRLSDEWKKEDKEEVEVNEDANENVSEELSGEMRDIIDWL
ncbi:helix-turn-helix domain-containing protein [Virgibacillus proomii]|uniref:helix-turn-helix domain-containing protein n=1 Tax=Virgibacillus proomii TaxID=84407 RepID=UPI001C123EDE|nr:helix-turn-helix domain-containing protein [Virgibacillus proomii]MBU5266283.1 helix-turn-helix domain-containing protein [Virgibacillus proomii]